MFNLLILFYFYLCASNCVSIDASDCLDQKKNSKLIDTVEASVVVCICF